MLSRIKQLLFPETILYGRGAFSEVGVQAKRLGKKALIISDPIMTKIGKVEICKEHVSQQNMSYSLYLNVDTEPTVTHVNEALAICEAENCDVIIALGGGSCIDTAKAVAAIRTNGGQISDYVRNRKLFVNPPIPLIAVPTTAGTGSEVTKVTVITDPETHVKMMISQTHLLPKVAIVDPLLTLSCPPSVTAATGIDALCHAIEAYISRRSQPVTDSLALSAIEHIFPNLREVYVNGSNIDAREKVAIGAMLAGAAFSNASVTLVHGMSRPIGAQFYVPHGVSNAMLLPAVLEYSINEAKDRLADICRIVNPEVKIDSPLQAAQKLINEIKLLCQDLQIPNMKKWGIDRKEFDGHVSKMATDALESGSPANNPKVPTHEEIMKLYDRTYDYDFDSEYTPC